MTPEPAQTKDTAAPSPERDGAEAPDVQPDATPATDATASDPNAATPAFGEDRAEASDEIPVRVVDRRHWARQDRDDAADAAAPARRVPAYVEELEQRVEAAEKKLHEYVAAFKRRQEEFDAFRAQRRADVARRVEEGRAEFLRRLLPAVDQLNLSLQAASDQDDAAGVVAGVRMVLQGVLDALAAEGLEEVSVLDQPFDPHVAEAVAVEPVTAPERDGVVVDELRRAYMFGERCLRPAQVRVGRLVEGGGEARGEEAASGETEAPSS